MTDTIINIFDGLKVCWVMDAGNQIGVYAQTETGSKYPWRANKMFKGLPYAERGCETETEAFLFASTKR